MVTDSASVTTTINVISNIHNWIVLFELADLDFN